MGRQTGPASTPVTEAAEEMFQESGWSDAVIPELLELFADAHAGYTDDRNSVFLSVLQTEGTFKANHGIDPWSGERR